MSRLERFQKIYKEFIEHQLQRERLSRKLIALGLPGLPTTPLEAGLYRMICSTVDHLEAEQIFERARIEA